MNTTPHLLIGVFWHKLSNWLKVEQKHLNNLKMKQKDVSTESIELRHLNVVPFTDPANQPFSSLIIKQNVLWRSPPRLFC
jgi:hypothetical protein